MKSQTAADMDDNAARALRSESKAFLDLVDSCSRKQDIVNELSDELERAQRAEMKTKKSLARRVAEIENLKEEVQEYTAENWGLKVELDKLRHSLSTMGTKILVVPGSDSPMKADALARRIGEVMADLMEVGRLEKVADLRITGLNESVTTKELVQAVAEKGGCRCRPCKVVSGATGFTKVRCAVDVAKKGAEGDKLDWSLARVTVLGPPPTHCFKCMGRGHVADRCPSREDRSSFCFRTAATFTKPLSTIIAKAFTTHSQCIVEYLFAYATASVKVNAQYLVNG
ncbi:unnamed protein product [Chilo suppressalis]|uniref:CCHC-type domain-containing protein n=1 Tax=Chilo suppressalis TaxID=168631 RepID=A0ABN8BCZ6_CHISP|nr:unnamed protein product [Chilo suppressalis]